ncbi:MAG: hypothetical protein NC094_05375 [Bacteroidales bacterium]|nr:hypothetical protein [Lachnoclostridium sp.]MCM1384167.1 hypothetical protein [Lachnoclostridium sp.]MCM1464833.1 hypothetical protein [Bacteroidales bacterium]
MKKFVIWGFAILLSLVFIFLPFPASDLIIRIYFDEIAGDSCVLYYTTKENPSFCEEQSISSDIDYAQKKVEFRLNGNLEGHLDNLRLDFPPHTEQLICVKNITLSSAGVIRREYTSCSFFAAENIASAQETSVTLVHPRNRAYLSTGSDDPYILLAPGLTRQIADCYSHRTISRLALCLFFFGSCLLARKRLFI